MFTEKREKLKRTLAVGLVILLGILFLTIWPTDYYVESPGLAKELSTLVEVEESKLAARQIAGKFRLTAVSLEPASLLDYYYYSLVESDRVNLVPLKDSLPKGVEPQEYFEMMQEVMKESQLKAKAVALKQAGYQPQITGQGAEVNKILAVSNAQGKLKAGDIITRINDKEVELVVDLINEIRAQDIGSEVSVTVKRDSKLKKYQIKTKELENNPNQASLGILISSYQRSYQFPIEIKIKSGKIGGPSAGLMFTLEILNRLTPTDLTYGRDIAGTGTIALDGSVGEISGVKQKVLAAEKQGVDIFLAPAKNYQAAREVATKLDVVKVGNIDDALEFLTSLE
ncbi:MAG: YlbL family protein [Bacillota bacterium]